MSSHSHEVMSNRSMLTEIFSSGGKIIVPRTPISSPDPLRVPHAPLQPIHAQTDRANIIKLVEDNTEEERNSRTAEFELRARSMGGAGRSLLPRMLPSGKGCGLPGGAVTILELVFFFRSYL